MARYALLIDHDFCTGCHTCEVACQQEHNYPVGTNGVVVTEYEYVVNGRVKIDFLPFLKWILPAQFKEAIDGF